MTVEILKQKVDEGLTQREIAEHFGCSQTTIKYHLKKFGLQTIKSSGANTGVPCLFCDKPLSGRKTKFCSSNCKSSWHNYHSENAYQVYENQKRRGQERKKLFIEKKGGGCQICGYSKSIRALSFHHRDPKDKAFNLETRSLSHRTMDSCLKELDKCDLLCANCHMELHEELDS